MVRLVVLMACDSGNVGAPGNQLGSVAQSLHRAGFAAVVASRYPLSVTGSVQLTEALYRGLLHGPDSLESAVLSARGELAKDAGHTDWAGLQLYARTEDGTDSRPIVHRPYQGLASFDVEQRRFYHGRRTLTDTLWQRCQTLFSTPSGTHLLAVLGPSGSGKSSAARAGLLGELERRPLPGLSPLRVVVLKPGEHPQQSLQQALGEPAGAGTEVPLLVMVDQFEEVYTQCTSATERDDFVAWLLGAAQDERRRVCVILTLRSDFYGETQRYHPTLNHLIAAQHELVPG
jgi:hypothetical protein